MEVFDVFTNRPLTLRSLFTFKICGLGKVTRFLREEMFFCSSPAYGQYYLFTDTAAILNSIVSNIYYGMLRGGGDYDVLPSEHPIIDI